jgi:hypothetical protein
VVGAIGHHHDETIKRELGSWQQPWQTFPENPHRAAILACCALLQQELEAIA